MVPRFLLAALLAAALPAGAGVLYKSVDANGSVMFSDVPPPDDARILEARVIGSQGEPAAALPGAVAPVDLEQVFQSIDSDAALARANARVDMAERALALARAGRSPTHRAGLQRVRRSLQDEQRIEFHKRDLRIARRQLIEVLRARQDSAERGAATGFVQLSTAAVLAKPGI